MFVRSLFLLFAPALLYSQGMRVDPFPAEVRTVHEGDILSVTVDPSGTVWAATPAGLLQFQNGARTRTARTASLVAPGGWFASEGGLWHGTTRVADLPTEPTHIAVGPEIVVSATSGLYRLVGNGLIR